MTAARLDGWIPFRFYWQQGQPRVDWCHLDQRRLVEPFFAETVGRCMRLPFNLLFRQQTSVDTLLDWQARQPGVPPAGFIFHLSRCGSTLVAQMLAALPQNVVLSEPTPLDAVLHAHFRNPGISDDQRVVWLRAMLSALGQRWGGGEARLFVKFDSWHVLHLPLIRQAFPEVPWIFLYRDPLAVLVSHMRERAAQMVPGILEPGIGGMDVLTAVQMTAEEYCARLLGRFCQAALDQLQEGGRLVNYDELPEAVYTSVARFFGTTFTAEEAALMQQAARRDAKNPGRLFPGDGGDKQNAVTDKIREAADVHVNGLYEQLETARRGQTAEESLNRRPLRGSPSSDD